MKLLEEFLISKEDVHFLSFQKATSFLQMKGAIRPILEIPFWIFLNVPAIQERENIWLIIRFKDQNIYKQVKKNRILTLS